MFSALIVKTIVYRRPRLCFDLFRSSLSDDKDYRPPMYSDAKRQLHHWDISDMHAAIKLAYYYHLTAENTQRMAGLSIDSERPTFLPVVQQVGASGIGVLAGQQLVRAVNNIHQSNIRAIYSGPCNGLCIDTKTGKIYTYLASSKIAYYSFSSSNLCLCMLIHKVSWFSRTEAPYLCLNSIVTCRFLIGPCLLLIGPWGSLTLVSSGIRGCVY